MSQEYGVIHLPPTYKINYVNLPYKYANMQFIYVNFSKASCAIIMFICNIIKAHVYKFIFNGDMLKLHVDINKFYINSHKMVTYFFSLYMYVG